MGRVFFFIGEGLRALRRSAAPGLASIVTVCITVLLLGVLIPVLQTTNGKTNQVRNQVGLRVFLNDVNGQQAPADQVQALQAKLTAIPHVKAVQFVDKNQALSILGDQLKRETAPTSPLSCPARTTHCRPRSTSLPTISPIFPPSATRSHRLVRTGRRPRSARSFRTSATHAMTPARLAAPRQRSAGFWAWSQRSCWLPPCCWSPTRFASRSTRAAARSR